MTTVQAQIRASVAVKLAAIPGVTAFLLSPRRIIAEQSLPAVCLYSHGDRVVNDRDDQMGPHERVYSLRVEIRVPGRPEEDVTDSFSIAVRRALLQDDTLGGLANRIVWTDQQWDGTEDENALGGTALDFNVFYLWRPFE